MMIAKWSDGSISIKWSHTLDYKYARRYLLVNTYVRPSQLCWIVRWTTSEETAVKRKNVYWQDGSYNEALNKLSYEYAPTVLVTDKSVIKQYKKMYKNNELSNLLISGVRIGEEESNKLKEMYGYEK